MIEDFKMWFASVRMMLKLLLTSDGWCVIGWRDAGDSVAETTITINNMPLSVMAGGIKAAPPIMQGAKIALGLEPMPEETEEDKNEQLDESQIEEP